MPITKNSDRSVILAGAAPTTGRYGRLKYHKRTIMNGACKRLAASYDDWHWVDSPSSPAGRNLLAKLQRLLDPTGIEPPPDQDEPELNPADREKLDRTLAAVNDKLGDAAIEVQITVPGHKPRYKWHAVSASRQAQNWPADGRFFAVMIAGIDPEKFFDENAQRFLSEMGIWRYVQPAYEEARREYPDLRLAVALDNGL